MGRPIRLDDIVLFKPLTQPEIERIVDLMFTGLRQRLAERSLTLELTEQARRLIAQQGFDPVYGARPLKRFLQRQLETRIGRAIIAGEVLPGSTVMVDVEGGQIHLNVERRVPVESAV